MGSLGEGSELSSGGLGLSLPDFVANTRKAFSETLRCDCWPMAPGTAAEASLRYSQARQEREGSSFRLWLQAGFALFEGI